MKEKLKLGMNELIMDKQNFNENWFQWLPVANLARKYYLDEIYDGSNGCRIRLVEVGNVRAGVNIFFKNSVWAYRSTDEGFRLLLEADLHAKYGGAFYAQWTFFKVQNSSYLDWIFTQSRETCDIGKLMHFSLLCMDDFVDIISSYEPEVILFSE